MERARDFLGDDPVHVLVHHSPCDDGHGAAALFLRNDPSITLIPMHPAGVLLTDVVREIIRGKNVVFVDIAFSAEVMIEVAKLALRVIVLDHHVTNQTTLQSLEVENMRVVFLMDIAGIRLAWRFLSGKDDDSSMPKALYYIALKDVWQHESVPDALYFTTAFVRPQKWADWLPFIEGNDDETQRIIANGRIIYDYQQSVLTTMMEKVHYTTWRGYRIAIVNVPYPFISDMGAMLCQTEPERTIAVVWNKPAIGPYAVSLRSNNPHGPNIEQIALEFKGGGHVHGAGLRMDKPPYEVFTE